MIKNKILLSIIIIGLLIFSGFSEGAKSLSSTVEVIPKVPDSIVIEEPILVPEPVIIPEAVIVNEAVRNVPVDDEIPRRDEPIEIDECITIDEEGEYVLSEDIGETDRISCIIIQTSNVALDCQDHTIDFNNRGQGGAGILVYNDEERLTDVDIKNCVINGNGESSSSKGIWIENVENGIIENLEIYSLVGIGMDLYNIENFEINDNKIYNNRGDGIKIRDSSRNEITDNEVSGSERGAGIEIMNSYENFLIYNHIEGNSYGIYLRGDSSDNYITENEIVNNIRTDLEIFGGESVCDNDIEYNYGTENKEIYFYNEQVELENIDDANQVILCNADDSVINGLTIDNGDSKNNGLYIIDTNNAEFSDIHIENTYEGIYVDNSNNNIFSEVYSGNNKLYGILLTDSDSNEISQGEFVNNIRDERLNHGDGIFIDDSHNNLIEDVVIEGNYNGLYISGGSENEIKDSIIARNYLDFGITHYDDEGSCDNTLTNIVSTDNKQILYYHDEAVELNDIDDASEIVLCNADGSRLNNIRISNEEMNNNGLFIMKTDNAEFSNIELENTEIGIYMYGSDSNVIRDSSSIGNRKDGLYIDGGRDNEIFDSEFNNNGEYGINLENPRSILIKNNHIEENEFGGIYAEEGLRNGVIQENEIFNNGWEGVYLFDARDNNIIENIVSGNDGRGIYLDSSESNIVSNNEVENNNVGIIIEDSESIKLMKNVITNNGEEGILIEDSDSSEITDNIVENNGEHGILMDSDSDNNNLISNRICYNDLVDGDEIDLELSSENVNDNGLIIYNQYDNIILTGNFDEIEGMPCDIEEQEIQLNLGWNLISSYLVPYFTDSEAIFGSLEREGSLMLVKDSQGNFIIPDEDFNNIDEWHPQEGYWVKVNQDAILTIKGEEHISSRIELHEGWNTIAYPLTEERTMDDIIENVLSPLVENNILDIVKNWRGNYYVPEWDFNNIDEMKPGQGYMVRVTEDSVVGFND